MSGSAHISTAQLVKAVSLKLGSTLMFALMGVQFRLLGESYTIGEVGFFRSFFALLPILIYYGYRGELRGVTKTKRLSDHLLRGFFFVFGSFCAIGGLARIPLADFTALAFLAPLITVVFAALLLQERVHIYRWLAVSIGFAGVVLMLFPHLKSHEALSSAAILGYGFALANAISAGCATIQVRRLTSTETTASIVVLMAIVMTLVSLLSIPFGWIIPVSWVDLALLIGTGVSGGLGQMLFTESYRYAQTSLLAPLDYAGMIWAFAFGYWVFGEVPTLYVVIGAVIVAGAGIFIILRERYLGLKRLREVPVAVVGPVGDDTLEEEAANVRP